MAVIYAYPTAIPELQDLLIGTEMAVQGGEDAPRTRTFTIQSIVDLIEVEAGVIPTLQQVTTAGPNTTLDITANSFIKSGGLGTEYLMANGETSTGGGGGGTTNLSTTRTISNFTINSSTGDDAIVPLGNGSLAGATLNDYTNIEKNKLAGIAAGAEVNVNADWNAVSGDTQILNKPTIPSAQVNSDWNSVSGVSQILNKPTIPSINNADYVRNTDDIYTATAKITQIITLDATQYAAATKLDSTLYIII